MAEKTLLFLLAPSKGVRLIPIGEAEQELLNEAEEIDNTLMEEMLSDARRHIN